MENEWNRPEHAESYLARKDEIPHRVEGETTLLSEIPRDAKRILDLGCGDGHLLDVVLDRCVSARGVGLDFSATMLEKASERFDANQRVQLIKHDLDEQLPNLGSFDCVVSSFAIHHCSDERKQSLYAEIFELLEIEGVFCNLEHVASPSGRIHSKFLAEMNLETGEEDPSNKLLDVSTQLRWLQEIGFADVDCHWKWRELAFLAGRKPSGPVATNCLTIDHAPTAAEVKGVSDHLESFNQFQIGRDDFEPLNLVVRQNGNVIAGLNAATGWGWMHVQTLWIADEMRRKGLGDRLLREAEQMARQRNCVGSCLSSFSFQAPEFYLQHGYTKFGSIENYPDETTLLFLSKRFD